MNIVPFSQPQSPRVKEFQSSSHPLFSLKTNQKFGSSSELKEAEKELKEIGKSLSDINIISTPANDTFLLKHLNKLFEFVSNSKYNKLSNDLVKNNPSLVSKIRQAFQTHVFTKEGYVCESALASSGSDGDINFTPLQDLFTLKYVLPTYNSILKEAESIPKPSSTPKAVMIGTGRTHFTAIALASLGWKVTAIALASLGWKVTALELDPKIHKESLRIYNKLPQKIKKNLEIKVADGSKFDNYHDADLIVVATMAYPKKEIFDQIIRQTNPDKTKVVIRTSEGLGQLLYESIPQEDISKRFNIDKELAYYPYQHITSFLLSPKKEYKAKLS